ncbi:hypothetical protein Salat_1121000 [Sesamum alatum]|uniref:Uncharacterized protein n=1 Tax=Sesamum alatum TaxID=300844 RepID=A0AAE1YNN3_9LAMI|nr:hypothetical protein Salat_1121000 [Sesamum alatum]
MDLLPRLKILLGRPVASLHRTAKMARSWFGPHCPLPWSEQKDGLTRSLATSWATDQPSGRSKIMFTPLALPQSSRPSPPLWCMFQNPMLVSWVHRALMSMLMPHPLLPSHCPFYRLPLLPAALLTCLQLLEMTLG